MHLLLMVSLLVCCCTQPSSEDHAEIIANGKNTIALVQEFDELFPGATHKVSQFGGIGSPLSWGAMIMNGLCSGVAAK